MPLEIEEILNCFYTYIEYATRSKAPTKKEFLQNIEAKEKNRDFAGDMEALLRSGIDYNQHKAFDWLITEIIQKMR